MRPLRYSINVTLDGCCDHRAGIADEDLHRHAAENIAQADALLFGRVTYEMMEDIPNQRIVTRIVDTNLGYSGGWTYNFKHDGDGTLVSITEDADVTNVFFRFMSRFVFGHTATIDKYQADLAAHP